MNFNITRYLIEANQKVCPLISLEVACNMTTHEEIRRLPQNYERNSCRRVLQFVGDNPSTMIFNPDSQEHEKLNLLLYHLIDNGWELQKIGNYLKNYQNGEY
jgi:hypothetical protein